MDINGAIEIVKAWADAYEKAWKNGPEFIDGPGISYGKMIAYQDALALLLDIRQTEQERSDERIARIANYKGPFVVR